MRIVISGIPIDVQKKNIKNMHLQVKPPDGHVVISAPLSVDDKAIEAYARTQLGFIKKSIAQFQSQSRASKRQYVSGETMYIWGKQYFLVFMPDNQKNGFEIQNQNVVLSMSAKSTVKQREAYVKEEYRKLLKEEIEKRLPKWEETTGLKCDSWQTKYMVTKWGACSTDKKKLWFNLQLVQKPVECLDYIILHELTHLITRKHDVVFIANMDRYMPNWREIRKELNDSRLDYYEAQDESALQKLINHERYDEIKNEVLKYLDNLYIEENSSPKHVFGDVEIENVIRIEQIKDNVIDFDVVVSCGDDIRSESKFIYNEIWLYVHCQVLVGIQLSEFTITNISNCDIKEETEGDIYSGDLVPIISREDFEDEARKFLERYYPEALETPMAVPINKIATEKQKLKLIEDVPLSEELSLFGLIVFDDGNIVDRHKKNVIRNAKRGTIYIEPKLINERTVGTMRNTIAHECFHWHRHQPYHALMKMIGANDAIGKSILCPVEVNVSNTEKWKAVDWMEWQANSIAPRILMPEKTVRMIVDKLMKEYRLSDKEFDLDAAENIVNILSETYQVSCQAVRIRLKQLGYRIFDGISSYVNGKYIPNYSFDSQAIGAEQSFTIPASDFFKAYYYNKEFRDIISSGAFLYIDGHVCLKKDIYVTQDSTGKYFLTDYARHHIDECCLVFDEGFMYGTKYTGVKRAEYLMFKDITNTSASECTFELNEHNRYLASLISGAKTSAKNNRELPGSFAQSLDKIIKDKKIKTERLSSDSQVGMKTIQRMRHDEDYETTEQAVLGVIVGLRIPPVEANALYEKALGRLNVNKPQDAAYQSILDTNGSCDIYEINEILKLNGFQTIGTIECE